MISILSKRLKLNQKAVEKMELELESESWLYSRKKWKKIAACYLYSLVGHILVTLPVSAFCYWLLM